MKPFRVLVVDDSAFMRKIFSDFIERDKSFQVVGTAENGLDAVEKVKELNPDVITLDVEMPEMNGLDALKLIMDAGPRPVIMLSGLNEQGMRETILALEAGAFDFIRKPSISNALDIEQVRSELMKQLNAAMQAKQRRALWEEEEQKRRSADITLPLSPKPSETTPKKKPQVKETRPAAKGTDQRGKPAEPLRMPVSRSAGEKAALPDVPELSGFKRKRVERKPEAESAPAVLPKNESRPPREANAQSSTDLKDLVAVGCSTGGPRALKAFLEKIPGDFHAPIVIVQHMPPNFTKSLAQRLNSFSQLEVMEAEHGMVLEPGKAYIAPGGSHMRVHRSEGGAYQIRISQDETRNGHRPSVDVLFESLLPLTSVTRHAILMTGMGSDGARMMKELYDAGVTSTFAESEQTCVVYGMPRSAVELGCVSHVLPLHEIAPRMVQAVNNGK
ncbi:MULTISPECIES: chemotaxis response regulator protein-glutamate methylesterase [Paenibacillus]|uniref:protein-glutamate methylesterase/protein-glutamine glutaminase n=1 Tax=Paenibacillus TaxID=44249 RepID=UPI000BBDB2EF|nr:MULTISPECIES: chemotaxis response regulator protein-glutamate methylesterase [Paenibacillus]PCL93984.1 chemotaxis response regulator protein-glutamate methylesterase [Paenibacillus lautus]WFB56510.1 chemotaxis-specific protein-glutamate methyltransferase CheB [Paenibacillus sp. BR1-192]